MAGERLVLSGGRVLDPDAGIDRIGDVAIAGGRISRIDEEITDAGERIDVSGKLVVPGLIDGHAHCYGGIGTFAPDAIGVKVGVTALVDAASAGTATLADALTVSQQGLTDVFHILFVHPHGIGAPITNRQITSTRHGRSVGQISSVPVGEIVRVIDEHRDVVRALKTSAFPDRGPEWIRMVKTIAGWSGVPAYFHIGNFGHDTDVRSSIGPHFRELDAGDIVTHIYTNATGGILDEDGVVEPEVLTAAERGVHFDLGFGPTGFDFGVAEQARKQGVDLGSISTDWQQLSPKRAGYDLVGLMGLISALGFTVEEIIPMVTSVPARMFGLAEEGHGTLRPETRADVTVLEVEKGEFECRDLTRKTRMAPLRFDVVTTIKAGQVIEPDRGAPHEASNRRYDILDDVDDAASSVDSSAREVLLRCATLLGVVSDWDPEGLHRTLHNLIAECGLSLAEGLAAINGSLTGRPDGPQLGWWLTSLLEERSVDVPARLKAVAERL